MRDGTLESSKAPKSIRSTQTASRTSDRLRLLRARLPRDRCYRPRLKRITALWLSSSIDIAASVVGACPSRVRSNVVELFRVRALGSSDPIKFGQARVVAEQRLQARGLGGGQLHLCIQDVQLRPCPGIEPRFGQTHRFIGLFDSFLCRLN